jgi:hypothetical protein
MSLWRALPWLVLALPAAAQAQKQFVPVQADVTAVSSFGPEKTDTVALFIGVAYGRSEPPWGTPFGALGLELTYSATPHPYRLSLGTQLRYGFAWGADRGMPEVLPDFFWFVRVTPFFGASGGYGELKEKEIATEAPSASEVYGGARFGVGITSTLWSRAFLSEQPFAEERGAYGDTMRVLSTLLLLPIALFNHAELTFELVAGPSKVQGSLGFRVGAGF